MKEFIEKDERVYEAKEIFREDAASELAGILVQKAHIQTEIDRLAIWLGRS